MIENEIGVKVKKLKTDNGDEYVDTTFKNFCYEHGIRMGEQFRVHLSKMV